MTTLTRPIKRELRIPTINKPVIVEIDPDTKTLGFHEKGCRKVYRIPIHTAYMMAILTEEKGGRCCAPTVPVSITPK